MFVSVKLTNRIWQCFVCGEKFEEYGEYAQHITQEHAEGRDFLICPVDTCCAPVRDMRAHFKAKHPNRPMPKNCQMKTTVWRDFSANGKKKTSKPVKFNEGWKQSGEVTCGSFSHDRIRGQIENAS